MSKVKVDAILPATGGGTPTFEGDGASAVGKIKINCEQNTHGVTIQSPAHSSGANYTITLPANDGDADQFLQTNGSGVTSWAAPADSSFPIGASAHIGGSHQSVATGTATKLAFNTELYDPNSNFNTTTYAYTVPSGQAGKYLVTAFAGAQALGDGIRMNVQIYKNNSSALTSYASASGNFSEYTSVTGVLDLAAADYIEVWGWHNKGSNADFSASAYDSVFSIQRIV